MFKMSAGMGVMNCADNTGDNKLAVSTVKGIGGRLNKITVTRLDVMCVEEGQVCAQEEGDVRGGDLSKEVLAPEGEHLHLLRGQLRSDRQEHLGEVSRQVNMSVVNMIDKAKKREVQNDVTDGRWSMVNVLNDARTSDHEGHLNDR